MNLFGSFLVPGMGRGRRAASVVAVVLFGLLMTPARVRAQQSVSTPDDEREAIRQLLKRVEWLEARIQQLEAERARTPQPVPLSSAVSTPTTAQEEAQMGKPGAAPNLHIRGFTDVTFHGSTQKGATTSFSLGQVNLFVTSDIAERFGFLSEIVFEAGEDNAVGVDVERLLLQYSHNDYFTFAIGRYHTAIGYYNTAYHHSTWFQTAIGRPFLFQFEDNGGILPIHNVGISASGRIPSGRLGLHYIAEVGNGRTSRSPLNEPVQNTVDENNGKAVNTAVLARPDGIPGLQMGFSVYRDHLAPDGFPKINQTISAAHVVYSTPSFEWLNEALVIRNALRGRARVLHTPGFYTQISRRFSAYRPYLRYQYVNAPTDELLLSDVGLRHGPSIGLRYDAGESVALKLQYDYTKLRRQPAVHALTAQFAFTF